MPGDPAGGRLWIKVTGKPADPHRLIPDPLTWYLLGVNMAYTNRICQPGDNMHQSSVFRNNQSQAIRLPKPVALPESVKKVDIVKLGNARLVVPAGEAWGSWFDGPGVSEDFMTTREQPEDHEREGW